MLSGRLNAAMMDNVHNYKKPYMNQLFMNAGPGEGVKPNLTRPPITGNLTYMPKPAVMPNPHIGHVGMNKPAVVNPYVDRMYRPTFYEANLPTSAVQGDASMRQYLADMLGKKSAMAAINSPVEEQGRSPM